MKRDIAGRLQLQLVRDEFGEFICGDAVCHHDEAGLGIGWLLGEIYKPPYLCMALLFSCVIPFEHHSLPFSQKGQPRCLRKLSALNACQQRNHSPREQDDGALLLRELQA